MEDTMTFNRAAAAATLTAEVSRERFQEEQKAIAKAANIAKDKVMNMGGGAMWSITNFLSADCSLGLSANLLIWNVRSIASFFPSTTFGKTVGFQSKSFADCFNVFKLKFGEPTPRAGIMLTIIADFLIITLAIAFLYLVFFPLIEAYEHVQDFIKIPIIKELADKYLAG